MESRTSKCPVCNDVEYDDLFRWHFIHGKLCRKCVNEKTARFNNGFKLPTYPERD